MIDDNSRVYIKILIRKMVLKLMLFALVSSINTSVCDAALINIFNLICQMI